MPSQFRLAFQKTIWHGRRDGCGARPIMTCRMTVAQTPTMAPRSSRPIPTWLTIESLAPGERPFSSRKAVRCLEPAASKIR